MSTENSTPSSDPLETIDHLYCMLSQVRGIVEIAIDTIEEQCDVTRGTRTADAVNALYGVVALIDAKVRP